MQQCRHEALRSDVFGRLSHLLGEYPAWWLVRLRTYPRDTVRFRDDLYQRIRAMF